MTNMETKCGGIYDRLSEIQKAIRVPKGQYNSFGKYSYRSCEDIVEAVKPMLGNYSLIISDEIEHIGERFYVRATAALTNGVETVKVNAYAREEESKKGMDGSQVTGAASSYARKYALNGLFALDDTKDSDAGSSDDGKAPPPKAHPSQSPPPTPKKEDGYNHLAALASINAATNMDALKTAYSTFYKASGPAGYQPELTAAKDARKAQIEAKGSTGYANPMTEAQRKAIMAYYKGKTRDQRIADMCAFLGREIASFSELTESEASNFIGALHGQ